MNEDHFSGMITRRQFSAWLAGLAAGASLTRVGFGQNADRPLRVAVSVETLAGANVNDARAAYKVWSTELTSSLGMHSAELIPEVFVSSEQIIQMIRQGEIDMFGITAWEYAKVVDVVDQKSVLLEDTTVGGVEYILLLHNASPFKKLGDLRGRQIVVHHHRDMNLLPAWMGNMLAAENLPRMDAFFSQQIIRDSLTQVVLPVFFQRVEVAALAHRSFETAVEMNPQLGRDLHMLAISPTVIPIALCFHKNCSQEGKRILIRSISKSEALPAGRQIVALYQSQTMVERPTSCMNLSLEMVRQYERISTHTSGQRKERP